MNKTLPKKKARESESQRKRYFMQRIALATLICGTMPGLMGLGSYIIPTQKVFALEKTIEDITYMQELSKEVCDATSIGKGNTLKDTRDESDYMVAKLSDGKCWMTQNLRIVNKAITSADSDVSADFIIPVSSTSGFSSDTAENAYYSGDTDYGAYYSWCAATAGCKTVDGSNPGANVNAASSICPKGWRLPIGGSSGEFQALYNKWTTATWSNASGNKKAGRMFGASTEAAGGAFFPAAGYYDRNSPYNIYSYGHYWSSTAFGPSNGYYFSFGSSGVNPADNNNRRFGFSVRCIGADILEADLPAIVPKDGKDAEVIAIVVPPVISIDAAEGDSIEVDPNVISSGTITAKVSANTNYVVQLSANQTSLLDSTNPNNNSIPASSNVVKGTNAWGIKNENNTYSAITSTPTTYYNTTTTNEDLSKTHTFDIGVSVAPNLPVGEYSTTVTITAVNN